jgi:hypothetical protein
VQVSPLYKDAREDVRIEEWAPHTSLNLALPQGGEFLVLSGSFMHEGQTLDAQSWLRLPPGSRLRAKTGDQGAKVWVKLHHLRDMRSPPSP